MAPQGSNQDADTVAWLRDVLTAMLDGAALPGWIEKSVWPFLRRLPDRTLGTWAEALGIDVDQLRQTMPDAAERLRSGPGREATKTHAATYRLVPLARTLQRGVGIAMRCLRSGSIPVDANAVQRDLPALGMSHCMPEGYEVAVEVASILETVPEPDQMVGKYVAGLLQGDGNV